MQRRLTIRTNPPGALVYVDDYQIGTTPVSTDFVYYGTRKIRLVKSGYETLTVMQPIPAPWYEYPGIDFVSENLVPGEIRDERVVEYQLQPQMIVPNTQLLDRGENLRHAASGPPGQLPLPPAPVFGGPPPGRPGLPASPPPTNRPGSPFNYWRTLNRFRRRRRAHEIFDARPYRVIADLPSVASARPLGAGVALNGAADAEQFWMPGDAVGEDANVGDDRLELLRHALDVAGRGTQAVIQLRVVHQLAQRALAAVELAAEVGQHAQQLVEPGDGPVDAGDDLVAAFAQRSGQAFEVAQIAIDPFDGGADGVDRGPAVVEQLRAGLRPSA